MLLSRALPLCAHAASGGSLGYVTDSAGLLTDEQRAELEDMAAGISEKYRCGVYIVTTQDYTEFGRGSIESCAEEIYDRYLIGFGETGDGILFLVSMAERDFDLDAHGSGTGIRLISIMGDVYEKLFYGYIYLRMNLDRAFEFIDLIINKCKNLIEIFNQCFNV